MSARVPATVLAVLFLPRAAAACPVCFGASDGPMLQGSNMGILALLLVTLAMLGAFGGFFVTLARRASRAESQEGTPLHEAIDGSRSR